MSQLKPSKAHPPQCDAIDTAKKLAQRNDMNFIAFVLHSPSLQAYRGGTLRRPGARLRADAYAATAEVLFAGLNRTDIEVVLSGQYSLKWATSADSRP